MKNPFELLEQNSLAFKLTPISYREIFHLVEVPCDIYGNVDGLFKVVIYKKGEVHAQLIRDLISKKIKNIFVLEENRPLLREVQQEHLRSVTRSLSIGDPHDKSKLMANALTLNMGYLYEDPTNDAILSLQVQSAKNFALFLYNKPHLHETLFGEFVKQGHHYVLSQPFISTLFFIGVLKQSRLYAEKDIELLFLTSYFKDIGMSAIPVDKFNEEELDDHSKKLLASHPQLSLNILKGRVPLPPNYMKIIENHHIFSTLTNEKNLHDKEDEVIFGFETIMMAVMDTVAAMITPRPFRKPHTLFNALDVVRVLIAEQYPQEFKLIVFYFKNFFKENS